MAENGDHDDTLPTSVRLPRESAIRLREIAKSEQRSVSAQIRYLIDLHIREHDKAAA